MLLCFIEDGEIILKFFGEVFEAFDGNGGIYVVMVCEGVIVDMWKWKIEYVYVYCVDNVLV